MPELEFKFRLSAFQVCALSFMPQCPCSLIPWQQTGRSLSPSLHLHSWAGGTPSRSISFNFPTFPEVSLTSSSPNPSCNYPSSKHRQSKQSEESLENAWSLRDAEDFPFLGRNGTLWNWALYAAHPHINCALVMTHRSRNHVFDYLCLTPKHKDRPLPS